MTRDTWPHLDHPAEGEGEGEADDEEGDEGQHVRHKPGGLIAAFAIVGRTGAGFAKVFLLYRHMFSASLSRTVTQLTF